MSIFARMRKNFHGERGAGLVEYALMVMLIAFAELTALTMVGESTSDTFSGISTATATGDDTIVELTPAEKWEKAQADHDTAIADAKATKATEIANASAAYSEAVDANKPLPKADRQTANAAAKQIQNDAKAKANSDYNATVKSANSAKAAAKAEYNATN